MLLIFTFKFWIVKLWLVQLLFLLNTVFLNHFCLFLKKENQTETKFYCKLMDISWFFCYYICKLTNASLLLVEAVLVFLFSILRKWGLLPKLLPASCLNKIFKRSWRSVLELRTLLFSAKRLV